MGFELTELALTTDAFAGDVDSIEDSDNVDPHEEVGDSAQTADRLDLRVIPPTKLSPKLGKLARSNPSALSKSP